MRFRFYYEIDYSNLNNVEEFKGLLSSYKVVCLRNISRNSNVQEFYSMFVPELGHFVNIGEDSLGNSISKHLVNVQYDPQLSFTFQHSNTRQPLHTDAAYTSKSAEVNFLICEHNAHVGGATTFADVDDVRIILERFSPELLFEVENYEVFFTKGENQFKRCRILYFSESEWKVNWNYFRIAPENPPGVLKMCNQFHDFLENRVVGDDINFPILLKKGDGVFFHDDKVLHGRNVFDGPRHLIKGGLSLTRQAIKC